jgi:hypothetical protein
MLAPCETSRDQNNGEGKIGQCHDTAGWVRLRTGFVMGGEVAGAADHLRGVVEGIMLAAGEVEHETKIHIKVLNAFGVQYSRTHFLPFLVT